MYPFHISPVIREKKLNNIYCMELFEVYSKGKDITVFDVDDTLVVTKSKIKVFNPKTGYEIELTPQEFNTFKTKPHDKFDFSDFRDLEILKGGKIIEWVFNILKRTIAKGKAVGIITARDDESLLSLVALALVIIFGALSLFLLYSAFSARITLCDQSLFCS